MPALGSTSKRKHHFFNMVDNNMVRMAQLTRAVMGHGPTGEYNSRMFPKKQTNCPTCKPMAYHSCKHILTCCKYIFSFPSLRSWQTHHKNDKHLSKENPSDSFELQ